jgi:hypothetical protein
VIEPIDYEATERVEAELDKMTRSSTLSLDFAQGFFAWSVVHCPATECKAKYRLKDSLGAYGPFSAETTFIGGGGA